MSVSETGFVPADSPAPRRRKKQAGEQRVSERQHNEQQHSEQPDRGPLDGEPLDLRSIAEDGGLAFAAGGQGRRSCPPTATWTGSRAGSCSTSACSSSRKTSQTPLLERVRFLAIFASNLDEFFMVRVAGLMRRMAAGLPGQHPVRAAHPSELLKNTLTQAGRARQRHAAVFTDAHQARARQARHRDPALEGAHRGRARTSSRELFRNQIYPVLTPLVVDPAHPFPFISGLSLNLAVTLTDPATGVTLFARVKVPPSLPRFLNVNRYRYVPIEDVIAAHLNQLFGGMDIIEHYVFRVTRVRELEVDEDVTENLLQAMERELVKRRFEPAVRLEVEQDMSRRRAAAAGPRAVGVDDNAIYRLPGPLDLAGLNAIADLPRRASCATRSSCRTRRPCRRDTSIFAAIDERDILVHHPYDSFTTTVQRLVEEAAADPRVLAIKQTLYRTSGQSPIVDALIDAAEAGKQVVVVVEIKARFDERANIAWARKLEEAGCHVVYGFVGMKTHAKLMLIVRQEPDGRLRRYCHIGTGNYHSDHGAAL